MESKETLQLEQDFIVALLKEEEYDREIAKQKAIEKNKKRKKDGKGKKSAIQLALF